MIHNYEMYDLETGQLYDVGSKYMTLLEGLGTKFIDDSVSLVNFDAKKIYASWKTPEPNGTDGSSSDKESGGSSSYLT